MILNAILLASVTLFLLIKAGEEGSNQYGTQPQDLDFRTMVSDEPTHSDQVDSADNIEDNFLVDDIDEEIRRTPTKQEKPNTETKPTFDGDFKGRE